MAARAMILHIASIMSERWFRVTLDLVGIRRSLSRADGTEHAMGYVKAWLVESGFRAVEDAGDAGDAWVVHEADLGAVEPAEVRTIEEAPGPP